MSRLPIKPAFGRQPPPVLPTETSLCVRRIFVLLCFAPLLIAKSSGEILRYDDWEYVVNDDLTATVAQYVGDDSVAVVPSSLDGRVVTQIGRSGEPVLGQGVTSVIIPGDVASINYRAFFGCASLQQVQIGEGVISIDREAFSGCGSLSGVSIPESVRSIGSGAFFGCHLLDSTTVELPLRFMTLLGVFFDGELAANLMIRSIAARVVATTGNYGIATKDDLGTAISNAVSHTVSQIQATPNEYDLYSPAQFQENYSKGVAVGTALVTGNPSGYGLYTPDSIMDLRMGGAMVQKDGSNAVVIFQPQSTTDLVTQPFTNNGAPVTNTIPMPGDKGFLRIQAKP